MFGIKKLLHGWLVCTIFIMHLLLKIAKLTRSLRSFVRFSNLSQLVHKNCTHSPTMQNLYICPMVLKGNHMAVLWHDCDIGFYSIWWYGMLMTNGIAILTELVLTYLNFIRNRKMD